MVSPNHGVPTWCSLLSTYRTTTGKWCMKAQS
uniref:Uncharacterized protein n=1 Tax=Arundo donax TaxID=35708 RepID=A0A0A8ZYD7_ARUDO